MLTNTKTSGFDMYEPMDTKQDMFYNTYRTYRNTT